MRSIARSATATPPNVTSAPSVTSSHCRRRPRRHALSATRASTCALDRDVARGGLAQLVAQIVEHRGQLAVHASGTASRAVSPSRPCIVRRPRETRARMTSGVVWRSVGDLGVVALVQHARGDRRGLIGRDGAERRGEPGAQLVQAGPVVQVLDVLGAERAALQPEPADRGLLAVALAPVRAEQVLGDPEQPALLLLGARAAKPRPAFERDREGLGREVDRDLGIEDAPHEVHRHALDVLLVERGERVGVAEAA